MAVLAAWTVYSDRSIRGPPGVGGCGAVTRSMPPVPAPLDQHAGTVTVAPPVALVERDAQARGPAGPLASAVRQGPRLSSWMGRWRGPRFRCWVRRPGGRLV